MGVVPHVDSSGQRTRHWERTRNLTVIVLLVWFVFSLLVHWFANSLNGASFIGFRWATISQFKAR